MTIVSALQDRSNQHCIASLIDIVSDSHSMNPPGNRHNWLEVLGFTYSVCKDAEYILNVGTSGVSKISLETLKYVYCRPSICSYFHLRAYTCTVYFTRSEQLIKIYSVHICYK